MIKSLATICICTVALAGCSSNSNKVVYQTPYCYTDQTITKQDETVSSNSVLQCTDRPGQQAAIQRAGIDKSCEEFLFTEVRNGHRFRQRGVRCEKLDGS